METIKEFFGLIAGMRWTDYLDIIIVAFLLYRLLPLILTTGTMRVAEVRLPKLKPAPDTARPASQAQAKPEK